MSRSARDNQSELLGKSVAASLLIVAMWAVLGWYPWKDRSLDQIRKQGVIRIGYAVEAPYAFVTPEQQVTGESPEVAKRIVEKLGIPKIRWVQSEFRSLISSLELGRFDVIAAGMYITSERAKWVNFSNPTFHVTQGLLVAKGNPQNLHSYEQLVEAGDVRIAVLMGSLEETFLREIGVPSGQLTVVPDALTGWVAVRSGRVDGLALSAPSVRWMAMRDDQGQTEVAMPFRQPRLKKVPKRGFGAFAFRKEDTRLLDAWNEALKEFINTPEHERLISKFGFTKDELPGTVTSKEVLSTP